MFNQVLPFDSVSCSVSFVYFLKKFVNFSVKKIHKKSYQLSSLLLLSLSLGQTQGAPFQASFMANHQGQPLSAPHRSLSGSLAVVVFLLTLFYFKPSLEFQPMAGLLCFGWFQSFLDLVNNLVKLSL